MYNCCSCSSKFTFGECINGWSFKAIFKSFWRFAAFFCKLLVEDILNIFFRFEAFSWKNETKRIIFCWFAVCFYGNQTISILYNLIVWWNVPGPERSPKFFLFLAQLLGRNDKVVFENFILHLYQSRFCPCLLNSSRIKFVTCEKIFISGWIWDGSKKNWKQIFSETSVS